MGVKIINSSLIGTKIYDHQKNMDVSDQILIGSDTVTEDFFGTAVAISDDRQTAVIGAYGHNSAAGAAYIFVKSGSTWTQQAKITGIQTSADDELGGSVAISSDGNKVVIGAYGESVTEPYGGAAYVFSRSGTTWAEEAMLEPDDIIAGHYFGMSVSMSDAGDRILVGALGDQDNSSATGLSGAAYVFVYNGSSWVKESKLLASDGSDEDYFGMYVHMSGNGFNSFVGAPQNDTASGAVYAYVRSGSTWTEQQKIQSDDVEVWDYLGHGVSSSDDGNTLVAGAYFEDISTPSDDDAGAAYIFVRENGATTWTQQAKLTASDREAGDYFGRIVSMSSNGKLALIGKPEDASANSPGAAYLFERSGNNWTEIKKLEPAGGSNGDAYGIDVSVSSSNAEILCLVGANTANNTAVDSGEAFMHTITYSYEKI